MCWINTEWTWSYKAAIRDLVLKYNRRTEASQLHNLWWVFKETVHLEMEILSSFSHHLVLPNLYELLSSAEHKRGYFEECWQPNSRWLPLTSSIVFFPIIRKSMATVNYLVANILQNIFFCVDGSRWLPLNGAKYYGSQWLPSTDQSNPPPPHTIRVNGYRQLFGCQHSSKYIFFVLTAAIDFPWMEKNTMEVNGYRQLFGCQHSSKYLFLCWW